MAWIRYDIFLSYSRRDAPFTGPFVEALRESGYKVFYDKESISVGDRWKERLGRAIRSSRVCILCWSENAKSSEIVTYEYSRAEGLKKPVLPWLLDATPLPQMIEIQGVIERDPNAAAVHFRTRLSWSVAWRRRMQLVLLVLLCVAGAVAYWLTHRPPPPWEFGGRVTDSVTKLPIPGVDVEAEWNRYETHTDANGNYKFSLQQPKPKYLHLVFAKRGYTGVEPVDVIAGQPFDAEMTPLESSKP